MKRLIAILAAALLVSCNEETTTAIQQPNNYRIYRTDFEGHTYLFFRNGPYASGLEHDPNCKCQTGI